MRVCGSWITGSIPSRIRWVKPRDSWLHDRIYSQPLALVSQMLQGLARQTEAAAAAETVEELFRRLEADGMFLRIDERVTPTMYRCATISKRELAQLRRIEDVVRMGRVVRIEPVHMTLQHGSVEASPDDLHVDCTAVAFEARAVRPVFEPDRITLQPLRTCLPSFNSALVGHLEATREDLEEKNRLSTPNPYPTRPEDFVRMFVTSNMSEGLWSQDRALADWMQAARLNVARGVRARRKEAEIQGPLDRIKQSMMPALQNLVRLQQP